MCHVIPYQGDCFGGAVLSLLHEKTVHFMGDSRGQELCLHLMQSVQPQLLYQLIANMTCQASAPYFEMLQLWIFKGIISDPFSEFLVDERKGAEQ